MKLDKILHLECLNVFSYLPFEISDNEQNIIIEYQSSKELLFWKENALCLKKLTKDLPTISSIQYDSESIVVTKNQLSNTAQLKAILTQLHEVRERLVKENLQIKFWKHPQYIRASGFNEGQLPNSEALLKELTQNKLMVNEKKRFVVDLWKSSSSYLVADEVEHRSFQDAASQIASLAIGHNHKSRSALMLRPEHSLIPQSYDKWDVARALKLILKRKAKLEHVYFVNSGAEAMETALRSCQTQYPQRRKIIAFEGSFHGRTLLALHTTHSPSKRIPFEIYKNLVSFLPFPEDKTPHIAKNEPSKWIQLWSKSLDTCFEQDIKSLHNQSDSLLQNEIDILLQIRKQILEEAPLAVLIEPMQCEGGDRYASSRFFRALRILTRAHDVALVIDEVQCGFGLGGPFFWHRLFKLVDAQGRPDKPDAIYVAKKAQVGACITRFPMDDFKEESCPASIHRGYVQAIEILDHGTQKLEKTIAHHLEVFQRHIGPQNLLAPRNKGYAFSFDLPQASWLTALVSKRFPQGLLFYPAGDQTARFRLWAGVLDSELFEMFSSLFKCFEDLQNDGILTLSSTYTQFIQELSPSLNEKSLKPSYEKHSIWPETFIKSQINKLNEVPKEKWDRAYHKVVSTVPHILHLSVDSKYSLTNSPSCLDELSELYKNQNSYTKLDLLWDCTRFMGTKIVQADTRYLQEHASKIDTLQGKVYEAERQTPASEFIEYSHHPKHLAHIALDDEGNLLGISGAAPISLFSNIPMLDNDPDKQNENSLYSYDLTLDPKAQGKGLGIRFKCEQIVEAMKLNCESIKSRNRHPEAKAMARLNMRLSAVITDINKKDYGGHGTALYQSISFNKKASHFRIGDLREGSLKNKLTLSNFVSRHFVRDTQILAEFLPPSLRHIYYASGRSEAVDKSMRLLRYFRPQATEAISLEGSYFGQSTACVRSLGGPWAHKYFDWPVFENSRELEQFLKKKPSSNSLLGFYAETPHPNDESFKNKINELKTMSRLCKEHQVPFVLAENHTAFWKATKESFCLAENEIPCDALLIFAGHQLGVLAVNESLFLDKPLMMISTWEGDEWSLALLKEQLIAKMP